MIIFALEYNNNDNNKNSDYLAYMQIRRPQMDNEIPKMSEMLTSVIEANSGMVASANAECDDIERKPVTASLRRLSVGESVGFPWEQRTSALGIANRLKRELARIGWDYKYDDDNDKFIIKITRTA